MCIYYRLISNLPKVDPLVVHNLGIIIGGIATCIVPLLTQYWMYVIYAALFAWSVGMNLFLIL